MCEQILQRDLLGDLNRVVRAFTPFRELLVQRMMFCSDLIAERLKQSTQERLTATAGQYCNTCGERQGRGYEFRATLTCACPRRVENPRDGDTHEGRSDVGAIINVLIQHSTFACRPSSSTNETDRINVEQKCSRAAARGSFGVKHVRFAE